MGTEVSYIAPAQKVLRHIDRIAAWQRGEKPAPVTIEWDLSNKCNLGCVDCHFAYTHVSGPWTAMQRRFPMNREPGGRLADSLMVKRALREVKDAGVKAIVWTGGGEPTTHPEWPAIVDEAHQLGLEQGMYTHGGLLTTATGKHLAERATWVVVSLDYTDADSYARWKHVPPHRFRAACDGILSLIGRQAVIGVSYLLHNENWQRARDMVRFTRELGAHYTTLRPTIHTSPDQPGKILSDRSWVTDALPLLQSLVPVYEDCPHCDAADPDCEYCVDGEILVSGEEDVEVSPERFVQYRDWTGHGYDVCRGITLNTTITPDGRVWVCPNRREFPNSCLGDLSKESFAEIWARHPGQWTDFRECRAMCRLNSVNESLAAIYRPRAHEAFV